MNGTIDLMPMSCRESLGKRARVRRWALAYVVSAGSLLGLWGWAGADLEGMRSEFDELTRESQRRFEQNEEVQRLLTQQSDVEGEIKRYNSLAWPIRITQVIDAVGAAVPRGVTITSLMATPRLSRVHQASRGGGKNDSSHLVAEIEGLSAFNEDVAQMVNGLERNDLFSYVTLEYTRAVQVDGVEARSFRVTCEIDLNIQYRFVEHHEPRGLGD